MKFTVTTSGAIYTEEQAEKLKTLGFEFFIDEQDCPHRAGGAVEVEISSLEELIAFSDEWGDIIFSDGRIEIYDDYRE